MNYSNSKNLKQEYLRQSIYTASPSELVVMLLDACIKNAKLMDICLERKDLDGVNTHCLKAQQIVLELVNSLDTGFEIASSLLPIYDFLLYSFREMNVKKDTSTLPGVLEILTSLRDTWQQVAKPNYACSTEVS